jgi:hypothetical protein
MTILSIVALAPPYDLSEVYIYDTFSGEVAVRQNYGGVVVVYAGLDGILGVGCGLGGRVILPVQMP